MSKKRTKIVIRQYSINIEDFIVNFNDRTPDIVVQLPQFSSKTFEQWRKDNFEKLERLKLWQGNLEEIRDLGIVKGTGVVEDG